MLATGDVHIHSAAGSEKRPYFPPRAADAYIGRVEMVRKLADCLRPGRRIAVVGPGGMGKTALCAEALKSRGIDAQNPGPWTAGICSHDFYVEPAFSAALASLARQLGGDIPEVQRADFVRDRLNRPDALLFLEGAERAEPAAEGKLDALERLLALLPHVTVLITSRMRQQAAGAHLIELEAMPDEDAGQLLHLQASAGKQPWPPNDREDWISTANRLGGHPLALRLAGQHLLLEKLLLADLRRIMDTAGFAGFDVQQTEKENLGWLFEHSADAVESAHPGALNAWYVLSLHAAAPLPLAPIAATLGLSEDETREHLRALVMQSLAEREQMPAAVPGQSEPGWRLSHALLGEWGRAELPRFGVADETIYQQWWGWWQTFLHTSNVGKCVAGGPQRYAALSLHFAAVVVNIERCEGESAAALRFALNEIGLVHQNHGDLAGAEPLV